MRINPWRGRGGEAEADPEQWQDEAGYFYTHGEDGSVLVYNGDTEDWEVHEEAPAVEPEPEPEPVKKVAAKQGKKKKVEVQERVNEKYGEEEESEEDMEEPVAVVVVPASTPERLVRIQSKQGKKHKKRRKSSAASTVQRASEDVARAVAAFTPSGTDVPGATWMDEGGTVFRCDGQGVVYRYDVHLSEWVIVRHVHDLDGGGDGSRSTGRRRIGRDVSRSGRTDRFGGIARRLSARRTRKREREEKQRSKRGSCHLSSSSEDDFCDDSDHGVKRSRTSRPSKSQPRGDDKRQAGRSSSGRSRREESRSRSKGKAVRASESAASVTMKQTVKSLQQSSQASMGGLRSQGLSAVSPPPAAAGAPVSAGSESGARVAPGGLHVHSFSSFEDANRFFGSVSVDGSAAQSERLEYGGNDLVLADAVHSSEHAPARNPSSTRAHSARPRSVSISRKSRASKRGLSAVVSKRSDLVAAELRRRDNSTRMQVRRNIEQMNVVQQAQTRVLEEVCRQNSETLRATNIAVQLAQQVAIQTSQQVPGVSPQHAALIGSPEMSYAGVIPGTSPLPAPRLGMGIMSNMSAGMGLLPPPASGMGVANSSATSAGVMSMSPMTASSPFVARALTSSPTLRSQSATELDRVINALAVQGPQWGTAGSPNPHQPPQVPAAPVLHAPADMGVSAAQIPAHIPDAEAPPVASSAAVSVPAPTPVLAATAAPPTHRAPEQALLGQTLEVMRENVVLMQENAQQKQFASHQQQQLKSLQQQMVYQQQQQSLQQNQMLQALLRVSTAGTTAPEATMGGPGAGMWEERAPSVHTHRERSSSRRRDESGSSSGSSSSYESEADDDGTQDGSEAGSEQEVQKVAERSSHRKEHSSRSSHRGSSRTSGQSSTRASSRVPSKSSKRGSDRLSSGGSARTSGGGYGQTGYLGAYGGGGVPHFHNQPMHYQQQLQQQQLAALGGQAGMSFGRNGILDAPSGAGFGASSSFVDASSAHMVVDPSTGYPVMSGLIPQSTALHTPQMIPGVPGVPRAAWGLVTGLVSPPAGASVGQQLRLLEQQRHSQQQQQRYYHPQ